MLESVLKKYRNWKKYRQTYEELSRLSSRELDDLGLGRGDIEFVARFTAR